MKYDKLISCGGSAHFSRRNLLRGTVALGGGSWLGGLAAQLARAEEEAPRGKPPRSLIVLWMQGGPSQLETFDPHFHATIDKDAVGGQIQSIKTAAKGIEIAEGLPLVAEQMEHIALVRSVVGKEGDHERGAYNVKTGFRMDPVLTHPAIGAVVCHQIRDEVDIPRHISIMPGNTPPRGGYLGDEYDAFKTSDPLGPIPDVSLRVGKDRATERMNDLDVVEAAFAKRRLAKLDDVKTMHRHSINAARKMMDSKQLSAFNVKDAPEAMRKEFGDNPFGRSCLTALRLIEAGVRCVEVTLDGWDSHANNLEVVKARLATLDPAYAALLRHLKASGRLSDTLVLWAGEFGRTPRVNGLGGRDHWPHGFTVALAGAGIAGGRVVGETAPQPKLDEKNRLQDVADARPVEDVHATVLSALGIDPTKEVMTPIGRPMFLSPGKPIREVLA